MKNALISILYQSKHSSHSRMKVYLELLGLFVAAFLSATFFPLQSELLFLALLKAGQHSEVLLLVVASTGNTLGSILNWWLGRYITKYENRKWFPVKRPAIERAERWFARWGKWCLLLSWMPVIGDPIALVAGVLRMNLAKFTVIVGVAKTLRYLAIIFYVSLS